MSLPNNVYLRFYVPSFTLKEVISLLPGAIALALFTLVEGISTAKSFAVIGNEDLDSSKEFIS